MDKLIKRVRKYAQENSHTPIIHGIAHWDRVYNNGVVLCQKRSASDVDALVVGLFAYLHDACREKGGYDETHGAKSADWIDTELRYTLLSDLSDEQIKTLSDACRYHTTKQKTDNHTINICFDSDRLDLFRVGIVPEPQRMASAEGAKEASIYW